MPDADLIDRVYEAAVLPELWPSVLDGVAALSGSAGTVLFTTDCKQVTRWTASEAVLPVVTGFLDGGWTARNPRATPQAVSVGLAGFASEEQYLRPGEREADPMYRELLAPLGYGWSAGTYIQVPSGDLAVFDVQRRTTSGPMPRAEVERLSALRPHLARAAALSTRLGLERARAAVDALAAIGLPAAVLGSGGRVLAANALLEAAGRQVTILAFDRVALVRPAAQKLLAEALAQIEGGRGEATASIPLPGAPGLAPAVAHVVPIRRAAHDVFVRASALLILTPLAEGGSFSADLLSGLFDLTPAEARVARSLAGGRTVEEAAAALGVSRETVRAQLKAVFAKTGARRQAELVRLLHAATAVPTAWS